jgi:hypothetical protein
MLAEAGYLGGKIFLVQEAFALSRCYLLPLWPYLLVPKLRAFASVGNSQRCRLQEVHVDRSSLQ